MSDTLSKRTEINLEYYTGEDDLSRGVFSTRPVDPAYTAELTVGVYVDDDSMGPPPELKGKPLQLDLAGSPRALEAFGTYLIALARLQSPDPDPHEHFEDVRNADGGTIHLIVRRRK